MEASIGDTNEVAPSSYIPDGWRAGATWDGATQTGTITTGPVDEAPTDWGFFLEKRGLDPDLFEVVGETIKFTSWDGWFRDPRTPKEPAVSKILYSFRGDLRLRGGHAVPDDIDYLALYKEAQERPPANSVHKDGDTWFVINLSDFQVGNADGGGLETQMIALASLPDKAISQLQALRVSGTKIAGIAIIGLGDLFENCEGFYRHQAFTVEANMRRQAQIIRRAIFSLIDELAPLAPRMIVGAVGGNHGENRGSGSKYVTDKADNNDVAVFEQIYEICLANPDRFDHIDWRIPDDELAITINFDGYFVAFTHGHIPRPKQSALQTVWSWWEKQAFGGHYAGVANAHLLVTGHYHHFNIKEQRGRTVMIAPSLTDVSAYYGDSQGVQSAPGVLTFTVDRNGWDNVKVLRCL